MIFASAICAIIAVTGSFVAASLTIQSISSNQNGWTGNINSIPGVGTVTTSLAASTVDALLSRTNIGSGSSDVAYDATDHVVYLPGCGPGLQYICAVSEATGVLTSTLTISGLGFPEQAVWDPSNDYLYVAYNGGYIAVVDASTNTLVTSFSTGASTSALGLALDPVDGDLYISNYQFSTPAIYVFSATAYTSVATITTSVPPYPHREVYDPTDNEIFVAGDSAAASVAVVSGATNAVVATISMPTNLPLQLAYDGATSEVYVTCYGNGASPGSSVVISTASNTVTYTIPVGVEPYSSVYDPASGEVFVTNVLSSTVSVISDITHTVVTSIARVTAYYGAYDPHDESIYMADGSGNVYKLSGAPALYSAATVVLPGGGATATVCASAAGCSLGDPTELVSITYTGQSTGQTFTVQVMATGGGASYTGGVDTFQDLGGSLGTTTILIALDLGGGSGQTISTVSIVANG